MEYLVVIERDSDGGYSAYVPDLPGCVGCGDTIEGAGSSIQEAIILHIDSLRRYNEPVPQPTSMGKSSQIEVNSRRCPPEIESILLKLIATGILRIRAGSQDANRCFIESDHIHNLPELVRNYSRPLLLYYWDVERPSFIEQSAEADLTALETFWDELRQHVESPTGFNDRPRPPKDR